MTPACDNEKPSEAELAVGIPIGRHLAISLSALCITLALCGLVVANGSYLSSTININPESLLFGLWPFNWVYLRQLANSPYSNSDIKWFFTIVSCANAIWLVFVCWKVIFELFRRDIAFPPKKLPRICRAIVSFFIVGCIEFILSALVGLTGFSTQGISLLSISFSQSIVVDAAKILILRMFFLYVGVSFILEFGGLALRYWLARTFGFFLAGETSQGER